MQVSKRWRIVKRGEGYELNSWFPTVAGQLGYSAIGHATTMVDVVFFKRIYFRILEMQVPPFEFLRNNRDALRVGNRMACTDPAKGN